MRGKFSEIKQHQGTPDIPYVDVPLWSPGEDFPISFDDADIKALSFRIIKQNYKNGAIDKDTYQSMMKTVRQK